MPPLLADFSHARACKPFCEKYLTLPKLREGICAKPMRHHLSPASPSESLRGMSRIGG